MTVLGPKDRGAWTGGRSGVMWQRLRIGPERGVRAIAAAPAIASGTRGSRCRSPVKKMLGYQGRAPQKRKAYLRLRDRSRRRGKECVYGDESGFAPPVPRRYAYAPTGQRGYGLRSGHRRPRPSLSAARIGKTFAAPLRFEGPCTTSLFDAWLDQQLCPLLHAAQVVVMAKVPFHTSAKTQALITSTGATLLFLPPYSPDLTPIEHDCATLTKLRESHDPDPLDHLITMYKE
jgi:transposase